MEKLGRQIDVRARTVVAAAAIGLIATSCSADGRSGPTSSITSPEPTTTTEPVNTTTTSLDAADLPLLRSTRWVWIDGGELSNEEGRAILTLDETGTGGTKVQRSTDGTVYVRSGQAVVAIAPGATEPIVALDQAASDLTRLMDGRVLATVEAGTVDLGTGKPVDADLAQPTTRILAANGLSAERTEGIFETDDLGTITRVITPEGVRLLDERDEQNSRWELGGPTESQVSLVDFDGRFLLASRGPQDPEPHMRHHFLIDILGGTFERFDAMSGTVALATADDPQLPSVWQIAGVEGCPTWSSTPPKTASVGLTEPVAEAFDRVMLAVIRCDSGFMSAAGALLDWEDTRAWRSVADVLVGAERAEGTATVWNTALGTSVTIAADGSVAVAVDPDPSFELYIIRDGDHLGLWGSVGPDSAAGLQAAGTSAAERLGIRYSDWGLSTDGPELDDLARDGLEEFIGTSIGRADDVTAVDAYVTNEQLRIWARTDGSRSSLTGELSRPLIERAGIDIIEWLDTDTVRPQEAAVFQSLRRFASGGPFDSSIAWASEVVLAAGPVPAAILTPGELADRGSWELDVGFFRAGDGQVSALSMLARGPWSEPIIGPHPHCASGPMRSPAMLSGLRRVSIQRVDIDSCLAWGTVDLLFDADGRVAGVSVDYWEP